MRLVDENDTRDDIVIPRKAITRYLPFVMFVLGLGWLFGSATTGMWGIAIIIGASVLTYYNFKSDTSKEGSSDSGPEEEEDE